ncbi:MAG: alpha/beta hydrolase [Clostridiaceae bacterium]|nr:alpha/beta hydrolase [Clostridiaceae bacterium]
MSTSYHLPEGYDRISKINFSKIKVTPIQIKIINFLGALSCILYRTQKGIKMRRFIIREESGYPLRVTLFEPEHISGEAPCLLYFHGGAFFFGVFTYLYKLVSQYAAAVPCKVLIVHYRLSLKYPFPAAINDCYHSLVWLFDHSRDLAIDTGRIAVGGDSAGGALAAAVTQMTRDRHGPPVCFQMLIYPVIDQSQTSPSMTDEADSPFWNANLNSQMWRIYLRDGDQGMPAYASPINAVSFAGLPPAYIEIQEYDCLRDEGSAYADKLRENGIKVELIENKGTFHGFDVLHRSPVAQKAIADRITALRNGIGRSPSDSAA